MGLVKVFTRKVLTNNQMDRTIWSGASPSPVLHSVLMRRITLLAEMELFIHLLALDSSLTQG